MGRHLMVKPTCPVVKDTPPSDRAEHVSQAFKDGDIGVDDLYARYTEAGLSPEEADEMCNLMEQDDE